MEDSLPEIKASRIPKIDKIINNKINDHNPL